MIIAFKVNPTILIEAPILMSNGAEKPNMKLKIEYKNKKT
jgi:hypothetical protein